MISRRIPGLRLGDLLRLSWSHVGEDAIAIATGKSKHRREAIIPLYDALRDVLAGIPKRSTTILTNSRRGHGQANGFGTSFNRAKIAAGMAERDLHFHDLRGTAATRFYIAGLSERVIAEIMAMGGGARREDHPPLCRPVGGHKGRDRATQQAKGEHNLQNRLQNRPANFG